MRDLAYSVLDLVVPQDHSLAVTTNPVMADLADLDFIDAPIGYGIRTVADQAFDAAGVRRRVSIEIADIGTGVDYVRHGLGVALLPRYILDAVAELPVKRIGGADLTLALSEATPTNRDPSAAVRSLLELIGKATRPPTGR